MFKDYNCKLPIFKIFIKHEFKFFSSIEVMVLWTKLSNKHIFIEYIILSSKLDWLTEKKLYRKIRWSYNYIKNYLREFYIYIGPPYIVVLIFKNNIFSMLTSSVKKKWSITKTQSTMKSFYHSFFIWRKSRLRLIFSEFLSKYA